MDDTILYEECICSELPGVVHEFVRQMPLSNFVLKGDGWSKDNYCKEAS
jgi:hypothetical protein